MAKESDLLLSKNSNKMKTNKTNSKMTTSIDNKHDRHNHKALTFAQKVGRTLNPKGRKGLVEKSGK